jgi:IS6 family transposase
LSLVRRHWRALSQIICWMVFIEVITPECEDYLMLDAIFEGRHFPPDIILWGVRWYCRYPISYRNLEEMMSERGVQVDHSTLARWVQRLGPEIEKRLRKQPSWVQGSWRVDETSIYIKGEVHWLYRAVDAKGNTVDFWLSKTQDKKAAKRFFQKSLKKPSNPKPNKVTTDGHLAYPAAIDELKKEQQLPEAVIHRRSKYLNNRIESDHSRFKQPLKPMRGFKTFRTAKKTIAGMEAMLMLRKRQFKTMNHYHTEVEFVHSLFGLTA